MEKKNADDQISDVKPSFSWTVPRNAHLIRQGMSWSFERSRVPVEAHASQGEFNINFSTRFERGLGGRHVLAEACKMGHLEVVRYLLTSEDLKKAGHAPVDFSYQNNLPLYIACEYGHLEVVKYLLASQELYEKRGFLAKLDQEDFTDIMAACANEDWPIVRWLIMDYEVDLNSARLMDGLEMFPQAMDFVKARQEREILAKNLKESHEIKPALEEFQGDKENKEEKPIDGKKSRPNRL